MTDQEIRETVARVLAAHAPEAGFMGADVVFDRDFDGEPIIRVLARYERRPGQADALISAVHPLRSALLDRGEDRFVFLTNDIESERYLDADSE